MPLNTIEITVETIELPAGWITAKEANERATSFTNATFAKFMSEVMKEITKSASVGETHTSIGCFGANEEIYVRAMSALESLGYTVSCPTKSNYICIGWK